MLASVVQSRLPNTKPASCTLDSNFGHCTLEKYHDSKIHRVEEYNPCTFSWRVQSDSDGVAQSSPLSPKTKVCKHQTYVKRCILNAQRHKTHPIILLALNRTKLCCPICQAVGVGIQAIGACTRPEVGESTGLFEKNIKISVGEKKLNHSFLNQFTSVLELYSFALTKNINLS